MKLPMSRFKKVSGDAHHSVMRDDKGHELKISHRALSPKMRAEIIAMPSMVAKPAPGSQEGTEAKKEAPKHAPTQAAMQKPAYFGGGRVQAKDEDKGAYEKAGETISETGKGPSAKEFNNPFAEKKEPQKKAEGGVVKEEKIKTEGNQDARNKIAAAFGGGQQPVKKGYANGGEVADKPPVVINIGAPQGAMGPTGIPAQAEVSQAPIPLQPPGVTGVTEPTGPTNQAPTGAPGMTGVTGEPPIAMAQSGPTAEPMAGMDAANAAQAAAPQAPQGAPEAQGLAAATQAPTAQAGAANDPYGTEAYYQSLSRGINEQRAGLSGQAAAAEQAGAQEAALLQSAAENQAALQKNYQDHYAELDRERSSLQQDIANQHIDPNHFWNARSTGGKIATLVGMFIGGLGQNDVPALIQQHIARDIEAQKANLGKKQSLLDVNMKQFGNLKDATAMTSIMLNESIKSQLQRAAALAKGPMEKAKALQGIGLIDANNAQALGQIAMRRTLLGGMKSGRIAPEQVVRMAVPEAQQQAAYKELKEAQELTAVKDKVLAAYDEISKLNTVGEHMVNPLQTHRRIEALKSAVIPGLSKETAGRYTEADAATLEKLFSKMGNSQETVDKNRAEVLKLVSEKMHFPMLDAYGIDMSSQGRYTGSAGRSRIPESAPVLNSR